MRLTLKSYIEYLKIKIHNDQDLGILFRLEFPNNSWCKEYSNDFDLGMFIRNLY